MGLREAFSYVASTGQLVTPSTDVIAKWLGDTYISRPDQDYDNAHRKRRNAMGERVRWYRDDYDADLQNLIGDVYSHREIVNARQKLPGFGKAANLSARMIDLISVTYDRPPERTFRLQAETKRFREFARLDEFDDLMDTAHRLTNYLNETLVWNAGTAGEPVLELITPDAFDAIADPRNPRKVAGVVLDWAPNELARAQSNADDLTWYRVWDDTGYYAFDRGGRYRGFTEHSYGRIPGYLIHRRRPVNGKLMDSTSGDDILWGHKTVALLGLMVTWLSKKQGERQPVLEGALARMARGQAMDGETPIELPPEVRAYMLDSKTDPDHFIKAAEHVVRFLGLRYGLSYEQIIGTAEGERQRSRKLDEIRARQARRWVVHEREIATLAGFDGETLAVNHYDVHLAHDPEAEFRLWNEEFRKGLTTAQAYLRRRDPDLSEEDATKAILANLMKNSTYVNWLRAQNAPADPRQGDAGQSPQENGAIGGRASPDDDDGDGEMLN